VQKSGADDSQKKKPVEIYKTKIKTPEKEPVVAVALYLPKSSMPLS